MSSDHKLNSAFKLAVAAYKPWHTPAWNSTGNDAFYQIIDGSIKTGLWTKEGIAKTFRVSSQDVDSWISRKGIPDRKLRIKIWKDLKKAIGAEATNLPSFPGFR